MSNLPPLKTDPAYGYYSSWPEEGEAWIHPEDVALARTLIPSGRVFRREGRAGKLVVLHYGDITLRVRPTLWQEVESEGFEISDWVEVLTRGLVNAPRTGIIKEMLWDNHADAIRYQIVDNGQPIEKLYARDDLRHVDPTTRLDPA